MTLYAPPVPADWPADFQPAAADFNTGITQAFAFLQAPPTFRGIQMTAQSIPSSTWTVVNLDTIQEDPYSGWSAANHYWVAPVAGQYECTWAPQLNGATGFPGIAGFYTSNSGVVSGPWQCGRSEAEFGDYSWQGHLHAYLAAGDWVQPLVWHNDTSAVSTFVGTGTQYWLCSGLEICWVSE